MSGERAEREARELVEATVAGMQAGAFLLGTMNAQFSDGMRPMLKKALNAYARAVRANVRGVSDMRKAATR